MSQKKFEEWFDEIEYFSMRSERLRGESFGWAMYQAYKEGRRSMREEVTPIIFGQCESDNVAFRTVEAIGKLEL